MKLLDWLIRCARAQPEVATASWDGHNAFADIKRDDLGAELVPHLKALTGSDYEQ